MYLEEARLRTVGGRLVGRMVKALMGGTWRAAVPQ